MQTCLLIKRFFSDAKLQIEAFQIFFQLNPPTKTLHWFSFWQVLIRFCVVSLQFSVAWAQSICFDPTTNQLFTPRFELWKGSKARNEVSQMRMMKSVAIAKPCHQMSNVKLVVDIIRIAHLQLAIFMLFIPYCKQAQLPRPPLDFAVCRAGELGRDARLQKQIIWKKTSRLQGWLLRASHFGAFGGNHFEGLMSWCFIFAEKAMSCLLPRKPNRNMICKWLEVTIPTTQWLTMLDPFDPHRYHFLGPEKWDDTWTTWFPVAKPMKFPVILFEYFTVWFKDCHRDNQIIDILVNPFGAIRSISVAPHKLTPCGRKGIWCVGPGGQSHKEVSNLSHRSAGWLCSVCWFLTETNFYRWKKWHSL